MRLRDPSCLRVENCPSLGRFAFEVVEDNAAAGQRQGLGDFAAERVDFVGLKRDLRALRHLVAEMGISQVVYGTDNPLNWPVPVEMIVNHSTLTNEQKIQILEGNLMKLLKITS